LLRRLTAAVLVAAALPALHPLAASAATTYRLVPHLSGLDQPVYLAILPGDSRNFIVEKGGKILILKNGKILATPFLNLSSKVSTDSERGLLSMAFDPNYASNRRFYVYYTDLSGNVVVARYVTSASNPDRAGTTGTILTKIAHPTYSNHNGGQLQFDPVAAQNGQSLLYFGTGDGGSAGDPSNHAQTLSSPLGKLFRIDVNASSPTRVMVGYGLRNPWRFSFDRQTGDLRIGDVGQSSWEELDLIPHGTAPVLNFGWRKYEGTHLYHDETIDSAHLTWPFYQYSHANGNCAVVGGYLYRGSIASLAGSYVFGDLCTGNIWRMKPGSSPVRMFTGVSNLVSFAENPTTGTLYAISIDGTVWRIAAV